MQMTDDKTNAQQRGIIPEFNLYTRDVDLTYLRELCRAEGELRHFERGTVFIRKGERQKYCGIIENGYMKYSATDADGNVHITGFAFGGNLAGEYLGIVRGEPARTDIIAATAADVWVCHTSVFKRVLDDNHVLWHIFAEGVFNQAYTLYLDMHLKSPKERYKELLVRCPDLLQHITLREMASYLCITPTHLSRIRRELTFGIL